MTNWTPSIAERPGPRYEAVVRALEEAIQEGALVAGDRLPPQRDLADALGLSLGTVTRAYGEAADRGLVEATVGRGTFVRPGAAAARGGLGARVDPEMVDLSLLVAPILEQERWSARLEEAVTSLAGRSDLRELLGYQHHEGTARHRRAAARWIGRTGLAVEPSEVSITGSAQHAAVAALSVLTRPGDVVLAEELTNPGLKDAAGWLHLRLHGLPCDAEGILPEAFESACRAGAGRVLYTMPTYQNPTARTMSEERRRAIATVAAAHGVPVVEDGVHALMAAEAPAPLTAHLPDLGYILTSHSKTASPALRVGYLRAPPAAREELRTAIRATLWMASPLLAEIASAWIEDRTAEEILAAKRAEAEERQRIAREVLEGARYEAGASSHHLWLELPQGWTPGDLVDRARERGVAVTSPDAFLAGQVASPRAVRVCLGAAEDRDTLRSGLEVLAELLDADREG